MVRWNGRCLFYLVQSSYHTYNFSTFGSIKLQGINIQHNKLRITTVNSSRKCSFAPGDANQRQLYLLFYLMDLLVHFPSFKTCAKIFILLYTCFFFLKIFYVLWSLPEHSKMHQQFITLFLISKENLDYYVLMKVLNNALAFNKGFIQCLSSDISSCSIEYTK